MAQAFLALKEVPLLLSLGMLSLCRASVWHSEPRTRDLENPLWDDALVGAPGALLPSPSYSARTRPMLLLSSLIIHRCLSSLHK